MLRRRLLTVGIIGAVVASLAWVWHRQVYGPSVGGRSLREWLALNLDDSPREQAGLLYTQRLQAFRSAGETGVEFLLHAYGIHRLETWRWQVLGLSAHVSPQAEIWVRQHWVDKPRLPYSLSLWEIRADPNVVFEVLSRELKEVETELLRTNKPRWLSNAHWQQLQEERAFWFSGLTLNLSEAGNTRVLDLLTNSLGTNRPPAIYEPVLSRLKEMRDGGIRAVPSIIAMAENPAAYPHAASALEAITGEAKLPLEVIARAATNGHVHAISALGEYGPSVKYLLPQLLPLTTNSNPRVSFQAEIAVRKIRGE